MGCLPAEDAVAVSSGCALLTSDSREPAAWDGRGAETRPRFVRPLLAAILSGLLMSACYWPLNAHWLAWIALVPWLVMLPRASARQTWFCGAILGLVFYSIGLAWLFAVDRAVGATVIVLLSIWMGLGFRAARLLLDRFSPQALLWAVPLAFVGQEVLRCEGLSQLRFPLLALGYSQSGNHWIAQIASAGGVYGISFLIVLVNVTIAWAIIRRCWRGLLPAVASVAVVLALAVLLQPRDYKHLPRIPAACIQVTREDPRLIQSLTRQAANDASAPRLLVLPEHTAAELFAEDHSLVCALENLARTCGAIICVGAHISAPHGAACPFSNVSMLIGSDGRILGQQPKMVPLPFFQDGEPGRTQSVMPTDYGAVGMYVCYDGLFTDMPRHVVQAGAQVVLVPNMDDQSWPVQERWQHADMAPFRSIELRRCAIRANGAGISQIIDATGRVTARRTIKDGAGVVLGDVYLLSERTAFVRGGYLLAPAVGVIFALLVAWLTCRQWWARLAPRRLPGGSFGRLRHRSLPAGRPVAS